MRQAETACVTEFENTGAGFFSTISVGAHPPLLTAASPLDGGRGSVDGIEFGMGFLIFHENGRVTLIEGYSFGDDSTVDIDFEAVSFDLKPWSSAGI